MHHYPDGSSSTDLTIVCLIGASLPTVEACHEAVCILQEAQQRGVTPNDLWELSRLAVWEGLPAARAALGAMCSNISDVTTSCQPTATTRAAEWSDEIDWFADDEEDVLPARSTMPDAAPCTGERAQLPLL